MLCIMYIYYSFYEEDLNFVYLKALIPVFLLQNNLCEITRRTHKFKRLFCTKKKKKIRLRFGMTNLVITHLGQKLSLKQNVFYLK